MNFHLHGIVTVTAKPCHIFDVHFLSLIMKVEDRNLWSSHQIINKAIMPTIHIVGEYRSLNIPSPMGYFAMKDASAGAARTKVSSMRKSTIIESAIRSATNEPITVVKCALERPATKVQRQSSPTRGRSRLRA